VFYDKWYTVVNYGYGAILLVVAYKYHKDLLQKYMATFLFMLVPFFIVNGILTGTGITDQVVWYNNAENLNFRLGTIPIEDITYAFTLILTNLALMAFFEKK
jgi:lycopene cyclase domain-containing protein